MSCLRGEESRGGFRGAARPWRRYRFVENVFCVREFHHGHARSCPSSCTPRGSALQTSRAGVVAPRAEMREMEVLR